MLPTAADAAAAVAALLVEVVRAGGSLSLCGGSTPRAAYELAADEEADWGGALLWLGDERCVPPEDERSNARLVRESIVFRVRVPPELRAVRTELPPVEAAAAYDDELRDARLDLALLGIGPDGHTASLFPDSPALAEQTRRAVAAEPALEPWVDRVTMTPPMLGSAAHAVFLAVGEGKADAARRAFAEPPSPSTPASLVRGTRTTAILDRAAASRL